MKWHSQRSLEFQRELDQTALGSCHSVPLFLICEMVGVGRGSRPPPAREAVESPGHQQELQMGPPAGSGSTHTVAMPTIHTINTASVGLGLPPSWEDPATP